MQRLSKSKQMNLKSAAIGFFWVMGLLAAGSEGPHMPWVNLAGLFVFFMTSVAMGKLLREATKKTTASTVSHVRLTRKKTVSYKAGQNQRVPIRCATLS